MAVRTMEDLRKRSARLGGLNAGQTTPQTTGQPMGGLASSLPQLDRMNTQPAGNQLRSSLGQNGVPQPMAATGMGGLGAKPNDGPGLKTGTTNVADIAGEISSQDSAIMQRARTAGLQQANARGLLNSSIAVGAAQGEVLDRAIPMAGQTAQIRADSQMSNQQSGERMREAEQGFGFNTALEQQQIEAAKALSAQQSGERMTEAEQDYGFTRALERIRGQESRLTQGQQLTFQKEQAERDYGYQRGLQEQQGQIQSNLSAQDYAQQYNLDRAQGADVRKLSAQEFGQAMQLSDQEIQAQFGLSKQEFSQQRELMRLERAEIAKLSDQEFRQSLQLSDQEIEARFGLQREQFLMERQTSQILQDDDQRHQIDMSRQEFAQAMQLSDQEIKAQFGLQRNELDQAWNRLQDEQAHAVGMSSIETANAMKLTDNEFKNRMKMSKQDFTFERALSRDEFQYAGKLQDAEYKAQLRNALEMTGAELESALTLSDQDFRQQFQITREEFENAYTLQQSEQGFNERMERVSNAFQLQLTAEEFNNALTLSDREIQARYGLQAEEFAQQYQLQQQVIAGEDALRTKLAQMEVDANDRRAVESMVTSMHELYAEDIRSILNNPELGAAERADLIGAAGETLNARVNMVETLTNSNVDWNDSFTGDIGDILSGDREPGEKPSKGGGGGGKGNNNGGGNGKIDYNRAPPAGAGPGSWVLDAKGNQVWKPTTAGNNEVPQTGGGSTPSF